MGSQQFSLRWKNHQTNLLAVFDQLLQNEAFVDVTLACDGLSIKAHKMVLSACSPYFQNLFIDNPCKHPIVILKDVKFIQLKAIVDFMYKGEVSVSQEELATLLKTAETLQIKGLAEVTGNNGSGCEESVEDEAGGGDGSDKSDKGVKSSPARKRRRVSKFNNNNDVDEKSKNEMVVEDASDMLQISMQENDLGDELQSQDINNTWATEGTNEIHAPSNQCDSDKIIEGLNLQSVLEVKPSLELLPVPQEDSSTKNSQVCPPFVANWAAQQFLPSSSSLNTTTDPSTSADTTNSENPPKSSRSHRSSTQGVKCTLCSKTFIDSKSLIEHSNLHLQRYECDVCGTCFANQRDLRRHEHRHIPIHLREPQFECQECGKRFHNQGSLVNHRNVHKERFKCDLCGHCSQSKVMLEKHIRIHL